MNFVVFHLSYCCRNRNKPKFFVFDFTKQTQKQPKQILFRFKPKFLLFVSRISYSQIHECRNWERCLAVSFLNTCFKFSVQCGKGRIRTFLQCNRQSGCEGASFESHYTANAWANMYTEHQALTRALQQKDH